MLGHLGMCLFIILLLFIFPVLGKPITFQGPRQIPYKQTGEKTPPNDNTAEVVRVPPFLSYGWQHSPHSHSWQGFVPHDANLANGATHPARIPLASRVRALPPTTDLCIVSVGLLAIRV
jgi:hypothetical protein